MILAGAGLLVALVLVLNLGPGIDLAKVQERWPQWYSAVEDVTDLLVFRERQFSFTGQAPEKRVLSGGLLSRFALWERGVFMLVERPLTGGGAGTFYSVSARYARSELARSLTIPENAHNWFLQFAADLGLPAFCLLGVMFRLLLRGGLASRRAVLKSRADRRLLDGLLFGAGGLPAGQHLRQYAHHPARVDVHGDHDGLGRHAGAGAGAGPGVVTESVPETGSPSGAGLCRHHGAGPGHAGRDAGHPLAVSRILPAQNHAPRHGIAKAGFCNSSRTRIILLLGRPWRGWPGASCFVRSACAICPTQLGARAGHQEMARIGRARRKGVFAWRVEPRPPDREQRGMGGATPKSVLTGNCRGALFDPKPRPLSRAQAASNQKGSAA